MAKHYVVAPGREFNYPADAFALRVIMQAGGRSKVPKHILDTLKFKTVKGGDDCSDMPASSLMTYLDRGWVIDQDVPATEEGVK